MKSIQVCVSEDVYLTALRRASTQDITIDQLVVDYLRSLDLEESLRAERARNATRHEGQQHKGKP